MVRKDLFRLKQLLEKEITELSAYVESNPIKPKDRPAYGAVFPHDYLEVRKKQLFIVNKLLSGQQVKTKAFPWW